MRALALVMLWLGVCGFGLATLCSGMWFVWGLHAAVVVGLVTGYLTWLCWKSIKDMDRDRREGDRRDPWRDYERRR